MAAIVENNSSKNGNKRKRHSLHIDMTPLVDLGFLLITFFVFTSRMVDEQMLKTSLTDDTNSNQQAKVSSVLQIVIPTADSMYCYKGVVATIPTLLNSTADIKKQIQQHITQVNNYIATGKLTVADSSSIIIKPLGKSNMQQLITVIDALTQLHVNNYSIL